MVFQDISASGESHEIKSRPVPKEVLDSIDRYVPSLTRFQDGWRDSQGRLFSLANVLHRYPFVRDRLSTAYRRIIDSLAMENFRVFFVETNRLLGSREPVRESYLRSHTNYLFDSEEEPTRPLRVVQYSSDLVQRIQSVLASYAKNSQESDRTFPERLVHFLRSHEKTLTEREILSQMSELEQSRQRLINLGFLDTESGLSDLTEEDVNRAREALTIYVGDVRQKLKVFDDMALRVGMLTDIINDRFRYKTLKIDRERGFHLLSRAKSTLGLETLSSGEQHQLVLLYELLFLVPKNGLVLVDEPEISLHVAWQSRFLRDLIGILEITGAHAIIATHAPAIIGNRSDLTVGLEGPSTDKEQHPNATAI